MNPAGLLLNLWEGSRAVAQKLGGLSYLTANPRIRELARETDGWAPFSEVALSKEESEERPWIAESRQDAHDLRVARSLGLEPRDLSHLVIEMEASDVTPSEIVSRIGAARWLNWIPLTVLGEARLGTPFRSSLMR